MIFSKLMKTLKQVSGVVHYNDIKDSSGFQNVMNCSS